jgi:hypothetical protein
MHLIVASVAGVFYSLTFILVPMLLSPVGRQRWTGKVPALLYFSLLGFGFIAIELLFIQMFIKLIGYPPYAVVTVLTVMLIGAGIGSMSSRRLAGAGSSRWHIAFVGIIATGLAVWLTHSAVSRHFMAAGTAIRILAAAAMISPMAFFMGMPFPLGILELDAKPRGAVAWAWSMNGLCTTIGSVATVALCLRLGFRTTELTALGVYALAWIVFGVLRKGNQLQRTEVDGQPESLWSGVVKRFGVAALWATSRTIRAR